MFEQIFNKIKEYNNIVLVRHIGADPDALCSQIALRDSIRLTFPDKNVYAFGNTSSKFEYLPRLDKYDELDEVLLIVTDTPDKKRVDFGWNMDIKYSIKIDHHPFMESFCNIELIDDSATSACEVVLELINSTELNMNDEIAEVLYTGIVSDTNRFMFNPTPKVFLLVSNLLSKYKIDTSKIYENLLSRPVNEIRLQGYISENLIVSENGFAYVKIPNDTLIKLRVDTGSPGNLINNFNYIEGVIVWAIVTEDVKNKLFKVNIRSRGPVINNIAERYNGGGHKYASGARVPTMAEIDLLMEDLDRACFMYNKEVDSYVENK